MSKLKNSLGQYLKNASGNYLWQGSITAYTITANLTGCSASVPSYIHTGESLTITLSASSGYALPSSVSVSGCTYSYSNGVISLSNPSANVTITAVGIVLYTITGTATNCFINGSTSYSGQVASGSSVTLNLTADGTSYKLPTSLSVTDGVYTRTSDTVGTLVITPTTNVTFSVVGEAQQSYPVKGQLITMTLGNSTPAAGTQDQYRVLSINGSIAEVVAMYDVSTSCAYNSSGTNTYSGAELDTMLNTTFYSSLSSTAKAAIVDKTITSYEYSFNSSVYNATTHASYADYSTKATHESIGSRHVYALDVEDIENYFSNTFSTANIWTLFWNTTTAPSTVTYPWLRSARADTSNLAWLVNGDRGYVSYSYVYGTFTVRPALTIDLSKISWS